ncbi:hypothetical protein JSY14_02690 [Brachybacterium sp. EF45031]|uniref:hypothetical protein n=1 Tax=Brachybacterium sillae TaxID=2810536 RepID=UPI00217DC5F7|nr:hypothetical protein [Brachybacterium sillae]MCS6710974.1 hypothetical protein [Brachybacterium sillae]
MSDLVDRSGASRTGRRSLMKGALWASPVVAMTTIAPVASASPCSVASVNLLYACKNTGGSEGKKKTYTVAFELSALSTATGTANVTVESIYLHTNSGFETSEFQGASYTFTVEPGETEVATFTSNVSGNLANGSVTVSLSGDWEGRPDGQPCSWEAGPFSIGSLPPCK